MVSLIGDSGTTRKLEVQLTGDASGLQRALDDAVGSVMAFRGAVGAAGAAVAGASVAGFGAAANASADFDEAMQESIAVMKDVDESMRQRLEQTARQVAKTTTHSHEQAAESFYFLASAGLDAAESVEALPEVAQFAEAGALDMAAASDYATDIMSAFGKEADDLDQVMDAMTGTFTRHNQTARDMGEAMSYVAPIASGLGLSIEETASAIGMMGDAGIKGSRAGRTLRQALKRLTDPPKEVQEKLNEMGIEIRDSQGNVKDFSAILGELEQAGMDTADIMEIFGARAGPGVQVLLEQGADQLRENTRELENMDGVTKEVAETQRDTFNKQLEILKSRLTDIGIAIGEQILPPLNRLLDKVMDGVERFATLNEETDGLLGTLTLAAGVVGGLGAAVAAFVGGPAAALVVAVGAIATAFATDFMGIRTTVEEVLNYVGNLFGKHDEEMRGLRQTVGEVVEEYREYLKDVERVARFVFEEFLLPLVERLSETFEEHFGEIVEEVDETLEHILEGVQTFREKFNEFWNTWGDEITTTVQFAFDLISFVVDRALDAVLTTVLVFLNLLQGDWEEAWDEVKGFLERTLDAVIEFVTEWGGRFLDWLGGVLDDFIDAVVQWGEDLIGSSIIPDIFSSILDFLTGWGEDLLEWVTETLGNLLSTFTEYLGDVYEEWGSKLDDIWTTVTEWASEVLGDITTFLSDLLTETTEYLGDVLSEWGEKLGDVWDEVIEFADDVLTEIEELLSDVITAVTEWDLPSEMWSKANSALDRFEDAFDISGAVSDAISAAQRKIDNWTPDWPDLSPPSVSGGGSSVSIPGLAHGGLVSEPTMAVVGEGQHTEAVVPLPDLSSMAHQAGAAGAMQMASAKSGQKDGGDVNIYVDSIEANSRAEGRAAARGFKDELRSHNFD